MNWTVTYERQHLDVDEERELYRQIREGSTQEKQAARTRLASNYFPLVIHIVKRHEAVNDGNIDDCIQVGMMGLWKATENYNESMGFKFATFAGKSVWLGLLTHFKNQRHQRGRRQIPKKPIEEFLEAPEIDQDAILDDEQTQIFLAALIESLPDREREIIKRRYGLGGYPRATLQEISNDYNFSKERTRQLQVRAQRKLARLLNQ